MKKILTIVFVLSFTSLAAQQKFTDLYTDPNQTNEAYSAIEFNNHYFFLVNRFQQLSNYHSTIYKTDTSGNVLDSLALSPFSADTTVYFSDMYINSNGIEVYGIGNPFDINTLTFHYPVLMRYKFDENLLMIDSFKTPTQDTNHYNSMANISKIGEKIFFNTLFNTFPFRTYTHVSDTVGNYLFTKQLMPQNFVTNISGADTNHYFINAFLNNHPKVVMLSNSLDSIRSFDMNALGQAIPIHMSISQKNDTSIYVGYGKEFQGGLNETVGFCILDTNGNLLHDISLPYDTIFGNGSVIFNRNTFSTIYPDNIYVGTNRKYTINLSTRSFFQIANLDSNLNIRWCKTFGGDLPYLIWTYYATSDGGCLLMGKRKDINNGNLIEPIVFKISSAGAITSVISLKRDPENQIILYPNPAKGNVFLLASRMFDDCKCDIYTAQGNLVKSLIVYKGEKCIDISSFSVGNYVVKVETKKGEIFSSMFVKE